MPRTLPFAAALAAAILILLLALLGGLATPGYRHTAQFMSELGATGAPHALAVRYLGFLPAGLALLGFCWSAHSALPRARATSTAFLGLALYAAGYVVAALFPCDLGCRPAQPSLSQVVHNLVGGIGYVAAPAFLLVFAERARTWPASGTLPAIGFVAAAVSLGGLLTLSPESPLVGLSQRALEASVLGWAVACGRYLQAQRRGAAQPVALGAKPP